MKKLVVLIMILVLFGLALTNCSQPTEAASKTIRVGTWNLEWFGALNRTKADIKKIASIIRNQEIDLLALQEITCECTLEILAERLNYQYYLSEQRTPQKLAILYNPEKIDSVKFDRTAFEKLERVAKHGLGRDSRQPIVFDIKARKFDFQFMVVHLKSIPESDYSVSIRNVQYETINEWLATQLNDPSEEHDIIIAGDFNSYRSGVSSEVLLNAGYVEFLTDTMPDDEYSNIWYNSDRNRNLSFIDHIAVTKNLRSEEFSKIYPIIDLDKEMGEDYFERAISDHLPLVAEFRTNKDRD